MRVDPDAEETTYAWDARGLLARMTDPEGGDYRFAYDAAGRRTAQTYPNGMELVQSFDAASRILSMVYTRPGGDVLESFTYVYDSRGNRESKTFADGGSERYGYDDLSRLTSATYPTGRSVTYRHDPVGNREEMREVPPGPAPPCAGDLDCDGVPDAFDDCDDVANTDQADADAEPANDLAARAMWRFEEISGTSYADSADAHAGTLSGGATHVADGKEGHAIHMDGVDDHGRAAVPMEGEGRATIEAWIRTSTAGQNNRYIVSLPKSAGGNGFDLNLIGAGSVRTCLFPSGAGICVQSAKAYADGNWHQLVGTYDNDVLRLYWDGALAGSSAAPSGTLVTQNDDVQIGRFSASTALRYTGDVDEVGLYATDLSAAEVAAHFARGPLSDGKGDACDSCPLSNDAACVPVTCQDDDGDGYGIRGASNCPESVDRFDCDDADPGIHAGVADVCDGIDNDCDNRVDEDCAAAPVVTTYSYNAFNQLLELDDAAGTTVFAYDLNGNQTTKSEPGGDVTSFTWDARDRLTDIGLPGGTANHFGYDTQNLRVFMDDSAGVRRILLDGLEERAEYDDAGGNRVARFDHDPTRIDALVAQTNADGRAATLTDALGSVHQLADEAARAKSRYSYDAFGKRSTALEGIATRWGFAGRHHEPDGSLLSSRTRYASGENATWLSPDPLGLYLYPLSGELRDCGGLEHELTTNAWSAIAMRNQVVARWKLVYRKGIVLPDGTFGPSPAGGVDSMWLFKGFRWMEAPIRCRDDIGERCGQTDTSGTGGQPVVEVSTECNREPGAHCGPYASTLLHEWAHASAFYAEAAGDADFNRVICIRAYPGPARIEGEATYENGWLCGRTDSVLARFAQKVAHSGRSSESWIPDPESM